MPGWAAEPARLPASGPASPQLQLAGPPVLDRWVYVVPFALGQPSPVLSVGEKATSVSLAGIKPGLAMVCAGGEKAATHCERMLIEAGGSLSTAGPVPGVRVTGGLRSGRNPSVGTEIAFIPYPLALRKPFAVPLRRDGHKLVWRVKTDEKGRFSAPLLAPGQYRLDIKTRGGRLEQGEPFSVPEPQKLRRKADPPGTVPVLDLGEVSLGDGVEVAVTVADAAGQPIAEAGVGAMQGPEPEKTVFFEVSSDALGAARLAPLDPALPVSVACQARGYARIEQHFDTPPAAVRCTLYRLSGIEGKVLGEDDKPISGATVSLRPDDGSAHTGSDGAFTIESLTAGERRLLVAAPGFKAAVRAVTLRVAERLKLDPIQLHPADTVEGKVVDGVTHEAVAGAVVKVTDPPGFGSATTGPDGGFSLAAGAASDAADVAGVGDTGLHLEVSAEEYPTTPVEVRPDRLPNAEPLRVELFPGGRIQATVWDEETDAPCLGCFVNLAPSGGKTLQLTTDRAGEALSPPLARGPYHVTLEVVQSLGSVVRVHGGENTRWVTVAPGKVATVSFGERRPVVEVRFSPPLPAGWSLWVKGDASSQFAAPRPDGSFAIHKRRGEPLALSLSGPAGLSVRQTTLAADFDSASLDLPLPASSVAGILMRGKEVLALARLSLVSADGGEVAHAATDEAGAFLIPYLPPGAYALVGAGHPVRSFTLTEGKGLDLGPVLAP